MKLDLNPFAAMALAGLRREYPNKPQSVLASATDVRSPASRTPAFYGCFDWHSAVHSHWCLARVLRLDSQCALAENIRRALDETLTHNNIAAEAEHLGAPGHASFEMPYGLAWVLQLDAELRCFENPWASTLAPLAKAAAERLWERLAALTHPIRSGEHSQTAFAMGLAWDWASAASKKHELQTLAEIALRFYDADQNAPLAYEPSGHDFLSPALGEADLMRRVLGADDFRDWWRKFVPDWQRAQALLQPVITADAEDGKLVHLDGLNLSRAWMLRGIARGLGDTHPHHESMAQLAEHHGRVGLKAALTPHYAGSHWLGSFAVYGLTGAGLG